MQTLIFPKPFVLLENRLDPKAGALLFSDPADVVVCDDPAAIELSWDRIERGLARGLYAAGFLSFELGYCLELHLRPLLPEARDTPLFWMGLFPPPRRIAQRELDAAFTALGPPAPIGTVTPAIDAASYSEKVRQVLAEIAAGQVYQVNLTFPLDFDYPDEPLKLYGALRSRQPVAHGAMIGLSALSILSVSPELFVTVAAGEAVTRPMKGTTPRCASPADDARAAARLKEDPKQRAENLMIVDLLRNDLSRISQPGSVKVPHLFSVETFPTFHAMTSTVTGRLLPRTSLSEVVQALFPCGSVVGAPKHRGMQIIRAMEADPRGVYTGAIGVVHPNRDLDFNVAIRTATVTCDGKGRYGVGGGIVADSVPEAEWQECLLKAQVLTDLAVDFGLIETLRWSHGFGFHRLELHLDRLSRSAAIFGFVFDRHKLFRSLADHMAAITSGDHRVRVELDRKGAFAVTSVILADSLPKMLKIHISSIRLDAGDPFLRHKTTRRDHYDAAFAAAIALGADETLLLNHYGDIADASRNTVFIERDGVLLTPPLENGALAGVLRRSLLDLGQARECRLDLTDLEQAPRWYIGNSLHGLRPATLGVGDTSKKDAK